MKIFRRESIAEVVVVAYSPSTGVCLKDLVDKLTQYAHRRIKIGSFSAASNVTGNRLFIYLFVYLPFINLL
jgi:hypothetical protein